MGLFDRFRKDTVNDPFGGDGDFYDEEESRFAGKGPKIALAASGVTFAAVVGFIAYVLLSAPETEVAAPVVGSFADLEIVDEPADAAPAPAVGAPPPVADATAATDRSAERRPWLGVVAATYTGVVVLGSLDGPRSLLDVLGSPVPEAAMMLPQVVLCAGILLVAGALAVLTGPRSPSERVAAVAVS